MIGILKSPIFAIGIVVLLGMAFLGTGATASLVPQEESKTVNRMTGTLQFLGGRGNTGSEFVASWASGGQSETITFAGKVRRGHEVCDAAPKFRYGVEIDGARVANSPEYAAPEPPVLNAEFTLPAWTWSMIGPSGGDRVVKGVLEIYTKKSCLPSRDQSWKELAVDGARLLDGRGSVRLADSTDRFAPGENVRLSVETAAGGPWRLEVVDGLGRVAHCGLAGKTYGFQKFPTAMTADQMIAQACVGSLNWSARFDGQVTFRVPPDAFRADGKNQWKFILTNAITKHAEERAFVIDDHALAPETPTVTVAPNPAKQGETVTLTLKARQNPKSLMPIKEFQVTAWYGSADILPASGPDVIANSKPVTASAASSGQYTGVFTFVPSKSADVRYRVVAIDNAGRPSGTFINGAQVEALEQAGMPAPNADARGKVEVEGAPTDYGLAPPTMKTDWGIVLLVGALALLAAGFTFYMLPVPPNLRLMSAVIVAGVGLTFAWRLAA